MRITSKIYADIMQSFEKTVYEIGGIIGSINGEVITDFVLDELQEKPESCCAYYPNVDFLNQKIDEWNQSGIQFMGVFHNHFAGVKTLSRGDEIYIKKIMYAVPYEMEKLYFPVVVLPEKEIVCYAAIRKNGIEIIDEEVLIIE